jgi:hypothetical protein
LSRCAAIRAYDLRIGLGWNPARVQKSVKPENLTPVLSLQKSHVLRRSRGDEHAQVVRLRVGWLHETMALLDDLLGNLDDFLSKRAKFRADRPSIVRLERRVLKNAGNLWNNYINVQVNPLEEGKLTTGVGDIYLKEFRDIYEFVSTPEYRRLAETAEGSGSMLDNTIMVWGVESGTNHNHSPRDMQYLVIGGKNLGVNVGQDINDTTKPISANKLLVSVMNAFGHPATGIGIEPDCGPLPGFSV